MPLLRRLAFTDYVHDVSPDKWVANSYARYEEKLFNATLDAVLAEPDVIGALEESRLGGKHVRMSCVAKVADYPAYPPQTAMAVSDAYQGLRLVAEARRQRRRPMLIVVPFALVPGLLRLLLAVALGLGLFAFVYSTPGAHGADVLNQTLLRVCGSALTVSASLALFEIFGAFRSVVRHVQTFLLLVAAGALGGAVLHVSVTANRQSAVVFVAVSFTIAVVAAAISASSQTPRADLRDFDKSVERWIELPTFFIFGVVTLSASGLGGNEPIRLDVPRPETTLATLAIGLLFAALLFGILSRSVVPLKLSNQQWEQAERLARDELRERVLMPHIRALCDNARPSYETILEVTEGSGLSQIFDPIWEVPTTSAVRVRSAIRAIPGGSIGIAGPRGVGKTTVLDSFCAVSSHHSDDTLRVKVSAPVEYSPREFLLHLYAKVCRAAIHHSGDSAFEPDPLGSVIGRDNKAPLLRGAIFVCLSGGLALLWLANTGRAINPTLFAGCVLLAIAAILSTQFLSTLLRPNLGMVRVPDSLGREARERLREIEYLQTLSAEVAGAMKLPVMLEGSIKRSHGMTRHPKGLPEIVDEFRGFLDIAARERPVVVGIDELDKIENDSKAHQFLNDVKSVFGVRRCHFLVSVSEDAMTSFERRGLPFRDVFDSAFDEMVSVGYLSYSEGAELIGRRRAGIPIPHKGLCFCLSGGLPRDLIRAARSLIETGARDPQLAAIARSMVSQDLAGKAGAVVSAVRKIDAEPAASAFIHWCDTIASHVSGAREFQAAVDRLAQIDFRPSDDAQAGEFNALRRLAREIVTYAYYCRTVLEFFTADHAVEDWQDAEKQGARPGFDGLARTRRTVAVNPLVGWQSLTEFRREWQMDSVEAPRSLSGVARSVLIDEISSSLDGQHDSQPRR